MLTALEKELMKKVMELEEKAQDADRYYRWWQEAEKKLNGKDKVSDEILREV